jgi:uncharacterized OsmC-like protein
MPMTVQIVRIQSRGLIAFCAALNLAGPLDEAQRKQLIEIAKKCPVHRTLTNKIEIRTDLVAF